MVVVFPDAYLEFDAPRRNWSVEQLLTLSGVNSTSSLVPHTFNTGRRSKTDQKFVGQGGMMAKGEYDHVETS